MSEKEKLQKIRARIDSLDKQIQDLINQRASAAQEVAQVKSEYGEDTFFYRPEREPWFSAQSNSATRVL